MTRANIGPSVLISTIPVNNASRFTGVFSKSLKINWRPCGGMLREYNGLASGLSLRGCSKSFRDKSRPAAK